MTGLSFRLRRWLAAPALIASLLTAPTHAADVELPPVDQVFVLSAQATAHDRIEVRWPSGRKQTLVSPAVDEILKVKEPL